MFVWNKALTGYTPQESDNWWYVFEFGVGATIGTSGRYLETHLAVCPDCVTAMITFAFKSRAVVHAASQIAFVVSSISL